VWYGSARVERIEGAWLSQMLAMMKRIFSAMPANCDFNNSEQTITMQIILKAPLNLVIPEIYGAF
jgi:hypothetical protein